MKLPLPALPAPAARRAGLLLAALCLLLVACGSRETREQRVRAVIAQAETAAEERDLSAIMRLVSPRFEDAEGGSAVELSRRLRGYLITHDSVHLVTQVETVEFPFKDLARVRLTVGTLGRTATGDELLRLAGDVHDVTLELQLERGEWKVTRAEWQPLVST